MTLSWTLSDIRSEVRSLTGRPDTSQLSDSAINDRINDYYQNRLPDDLDVPSLKGTVKQLLAPADSGAYALSGYSIHKLSRPARLDGQEIDWYENESDFWSQYPKDTGSAYVITSDVTLLSIGTSNAAHVKSAALKYNISGTTYAKASVETALSGDNVPQNKYGAWRLEVNSAGTISIEVASANATGYATPGLAIAGIAVEDSTKAPIGFVTVIYTAGAFVPGTTELSAAGVTATYTDGFNSTRQRPEAVLWYNETLHVRPKPDEWFELEIPYTKKPAALSTDASVPLDAAWGPLVAFGTAIEIEIKNTELVDTLSGGFTRVLNTINRTGHKERQQRRAKASF